MKWFEFGEFELAVKRGKGKGKKTMKCMDWSDVKTIIVSGKKVPVFLPPGPRLCQGSSLVSPSNLRLI